MAHHPKKTCTPFCEYATLWVEFPTLIVISARRNTSTDPTASWAYEPKKILGWHLGVC